MKAAILILLLAAPVYAEGTPFLWTPPHRQTANLISWGTAIGAVGLDTVRSFKSDHRRVAVGEQLCGLGLAGLAMRTTKHFVHRDRPDGSDDRSFYSGHTTYSAVSARRGFGFGFGVSFVVDTALFRQGRRQALPDRYDRRRLGGSWDPSGLSGDHSRRSLIALRRIRAVAETDDPRRPAIAVSRSWSRAEIQIVTGVKGSAALGRPGFRRV